MGIIASHTKWLLLMKQKYHIDFRDVAMLGRQTLYLDKNDKSLCKYFDVKSALQADGYSEAYWSVLAGTDARVASFDASDFEHATDIHDMNKPIPDKYVERYGVVFDGGTLEHVFDYTQGLINAMRMVSLKGYLILITPSNNNCGHGFYQFSPELFFSVLTRRNGFKVLDVTAIVEKNTLTGVSTRFYRLKDNTGTGERLLLNTRERTYLLILAKKTGSCPEGRLTVQQSDYLSLWEKRMNSPSRSSGIKTMIKKSKFLYRLGVYVLESAARRQVSKFAVEYEIEKELQAGRRS